MPAGETVSPLCRGRVAGWYILSPLIREIDSKMRIFTVYLLVLSRVYANMILKESL